MEPDSEFYAIGKNSFSGIQKIKIRYRNDKEPGDKQQSLKMGDGVYI
jgi:hypothetical protein